MTPAQTWAYEQYKIAREAMQRHLYPEALEALNRATGGFGAQTGYKLDYRFHFVKGLILQGNVHNHDKEVIDVKAAETSFVTAARYAKAYYPFDAAKAMLGADWRGGLPRRLHGRPRRWPVVVADEWRAVGGAEGRD